MESTVYIIKPEGIPYTSQITEIFKKNKLVICAKKKLVLPIWAIETLYPDLNDELRIITISMFNSLIEIGLIKGDGVIQRLLTTAGRETSPGNCDQESIRFLFGNHQPIILGQTKYYANTIHRSKNLSEAEKDTKLFRSLS